MDDISELLKEAKPLYFKRKRIRNITKTAGIFSVVAFLFVNSLQKPATYIYDFDDMSDAINTVQNGSVIEEIGLPVDEYGFLRIS